MCYNGPAPLGLREGAESYRISALALTPSEKQSEATHPPSWQCIGIAIRVGIVLRHSADWKEYEQIFSSPVTLSTLYRKNNRDKLRVFLGCIEGARNKLIGSSSISLVLADARIFPRAILCPDATFFRLRRYMICGFESKWERANSHVSVMCVYLSLGIRPVSSGGGVSLRGSREWLAVAE